VNRVEDAPVASGSLLRCRASDAAKTVIRLPQFECKFIAMILLATERRAL
jgi:hypothetical protein